MEYLVTLFSIIVINLLLSGDNALVIALASRKLDKAAQKKVIFWGSAGAIILRVLLTFVAVFLLRVPFLQVVGGLLLLWISIKLAVGEEEHSEVAAASSLLGAIKTIIIADVVMSIDNVIAIVAVAKGNMIILIIGLAISIPIIIWGSTAIVKLMERWPIIIVLGAGFLGWTAGEMIVADVKLREMLAGYIHMEVIIPSVCAILVVAIGLLASHKKKVKQTW